ncbi:MAG: protein translocase subunit SecF [Spirochaetales bacterium]|nr:protein translocase subunit SecF [Spirochaetales bacterium]
MKRVIRFTRGMVPAAVFSLLVIAFGIVGYVVNDGFNMGVDFQAGVNQYVQMAYPSFEVSYSGTQTATLEITQTRATVVLAGTEEDNRTFEYDMDAFATIDAFAAALSADGLLVAVRDGGSLPASLIVPTYRGAERLGSTPVAFNRVARDENEIFSDSGTVRDALGALGEIAVKTIGSKLDQQYVVRVADDGSNQNFGADVSAKIRAGLAGTFGAERVVFMKTDFVGASFSKTLADNAWLLTIFTLGAILLYATIRFKFQYGVGAVLAVIHDALIMVAFIVWTRMEFNTTTLAAILTILGYSINDTIVIFDRIREDRKLRPNEKLSDILNESITETLGRTIITTVTTLLAVVSLAVFTGGSIRGFAIALIVGMISGAYSTIFIASGFVKLWDDTKSRRAAVAAKVAPAAKAKASR